MKKKWKDYQYQAPSLWKGLGVGNLGIEILDTLTRNKSRSFLTGFGVFWGVFMLVALIGGGQGLKELLNQNFEGFATNAAMVWAQPTTKAYKGFRKGRQWNMEYRDVERLRQRVPQLDVVSPVLFSNGGTAYYGDRSATVGVNGVQADYCKVKISPFGSTSSAPRPARCSGSVASVTRPLCRTPPMTSRRTV